MLYNEHGIATKRKAKENSLISSPGVARLTGHNIMNDKPHRMDSFRLEGSVYIHNKIHVCTVTAWMGAYDIFYEMRDFSSFWGFSLILKYFFFTFVHSFYCFNLKSATLFQME